MTPRHCLDRFVVSAAILSALALALIVVNAGCTAQPTPVKALPEREMVRSISEFRVASHGFAFRNSFSGSPLPTRMQRSDSPVMRSMRSAVEANADLPNHFGLCGGMSLAAADYFYARLSIPILDTPPEAGTPLYEYLYQRQVDSWGAGGLYALRFIQWMRLPDEGAEGTIERSRPEVARIVAMVRDGRMVPIGLVLTRWRAGEKSDARPWDNHQVLCWSVEQGDGGVDLHVYDPNYPGNEHVTIRVSNYTLGGEAVDKAKVITISRRTGKEKATPVRGVFLMPYEPKVPPAELTGAGAHAKTQRE